MKNKMDTIGYKISCIDAGLSIGKCILPMIPPHSLIHGTFRGTFVTIHPIGEDDFFDNGFFGESFFGDGFFEMTTHPNRIDTKTFPNDKYITLTFEQAI